MYTWKKHAEWKNAGYEVNYPNGNLVTICVYRKGIALCDLLNGYLNAVTLPQPPPEQKIV